jgi:hypothetical protein
MKKVMILAMMLMPTLAMAELYKWIDAKAASISPTKNPHRRPKWKR